MAGASSSSTDDISNHQRRPDGSSIKKQRNKMPGDKKEKMLAEVLIASSDTDGASRGAGRSRAGWRSIWTSWTGSRW